MKRLLVADDLQPLREGRTWVDRLREVVSGAAGGGVVVDSGEALTKPDYPWDEVVALACLEFPDVPVDRLPALRYLQSLTTGTERLPVAALAARGVAVCNAAGTAAPEIAEFVLARILADAKNFEQLATAQRERRWHQAYGEGLAGAELVLVGFGAINARVAELAHAFGMRVRVVRQRTTGPVPPGVQSQHAITELAQVCSRARFIVSALPERPATIGLFHAGVVAALAPGALLINVGRGTVLHEDAVRQACAAGRLRVALDVFAAEPLPPDSPWWTTPGVQVSAHCASVPSRALAQVEQIFLDNLHRLSAGVPLTHQVAGPQPAAHSQEDPT